MTTHDLVEEYENRRTYFIRIAVRIIGVEDAEDMVQRSFLLAFRDIDQFRAENGCTLKTWLAKIVRNSCFEVIRKRKSRPVCVGDGDLELRRMMVQPFSDGASLKDERIGQLKLAVENLSPPLKRTIIMELSDSMPFPIPSTVKVRRFRAIAKLREMMVV